MLTLDFEIKRLRFFIKFRPEGKLEEEKIRTHKKAINFFATLYGQPLRYYQLTLVYLTEFIVSNIKGLRHRVLKI